MRNRTKHLKADGIPGHIKLFAMTVCAFAALVAVFAPDTSGHEAALDEDRASDYESVSNSRKHAPDEYVAPKTAMTDDRFFGRYDEEPYADEFDSFDDNRGPARRERDVDIDALEQYRPDDPDSQYYGGEH